MRCSKIVLSLILTLIAIIACAHAEGTPGELTIRGIFTGSFSEERSEASARPGTTDCLVVFDCAAGDAAWQLPTETSGITLDIGDDACAIHDTATDACKYIVCLQRYCGYGEPLGGEIPAGETSRMLALFYVKSDALPESGSITLTVGDGTAAFPAASVQAIDLPDGILAAEADPEAAHRLADWRWRMDSIIRYATLCEKTYVDRIKRIPGDHFTHMSAAFNNLLKEDLRYGICVASQPVGDFAMTTHNVPFDGDAFSLTEAWPPLDLSALKRALPGQAALIQYLSDNARAAARAMADTGGTDAGIDRLRRNMGIAYLDLCDAIGMPALDEFYEIHPAEQRTSPFIQELRGSGAHVTDADLAEAEVAANEALKDNKDIVKAVQQALNDAGFECGTPDGSAGQMTVAAITAYQQAHGLEPTGAITFALLDALGL